MFRMTSKLLLAAVGLLLAGCVNQPYYGRLDPYSAKHVQFTNDALQNNTAITAAQPTRDPSGLVHVTTQIRSTIDDGQTLDVYCTFTRAGQVVDNRLGPKTVYLHARSTETVEFNSTQPADDFLLIFEPAN